MQTVIAPAAPSKSATPARPADVRDQPTSCFADLLEEVRGEVEETPRPREKVNARPRDRDFLANAPIAPEAESSAQRADGKQPRGEAVAAFEAAPMDRSTDTETDGPLPADGQDAAEAAQPILVSYVAAAPVVAPQFATSPIVPTTPSTMNPASTVIAPANVGAETSPPVAAALLLTPVPVQAPISGTAPEPTQAPGDLTTPMIEMSAAQAAAAGLTIANAQLAPISGNLVPAAVLQASVVNSPLVVPPAAVIAAVPGETSLKAADPKAVESGKAVPADHASTVGYEIRPTEEAPPAPTPTTGLAVTPTSAMPPDTPAPALSAEPALDAPVITVNSATSKPVEAAAQPASSQPVEAEAAKSVAKAEQPADASRVEKDKAEKGETARAEASRGDQPRAEFRLPETAAPRAVEVTARALDPAAPQSIQVTGVPSASTPQTLAADIAARVGAQAAAPSAAVPVHQLAVTIAARTNAGNTRFDIRLDPAELGRIDVTMTLDREGRAKARIVVEKQETYELLRQDQRNLEKALGQAGAKIGDGSVEFQLRADTGDTGRGREGREPMDRQVGLAGQDDMSLPETPAIALYARLAAARGGVDLRI